MVQVNGAPVTHLRTTFPGYLHRNIPDRMRCRWDYWFWPMCDLRSTDISRQVTRRQDRLLGR